MADNDGRLLALFDELSTFLTKIRLYSSWGFTDSHELSMILELYNANTLEFSYSQIVNFCNYCMYTMNV